MGHQGLKGPYPYLGTGVVKRAGQMFGRTIVGTRQDVCAEHPLLGVQAVQCSPAEENDHA
jgi:hypothetical protein